MKTRYIILFCLSIILIGCSNKQMYEAAQNNRKSECRKLPDQQQEDCMKAHSESYEEYSRKREEVLEK